MNIGITQKEQERADARVFQVQDLLNGTILASVSGPGLSTVSGGWNDWEEVARIASRRINPQSEIVVRILAPWSHMGWVRARLYPNAGSSVRYPNYA